MKNKSVAANSLKSNLTNQSAKNQKVAKQKGFEVTDTAGGEMPDPSAQKPHNKKAEIFEYNE